jgi:hypothetical protein
VNKASPGEQPGYAFISGPCRLTSRAHSEKRLAISSIAANPFEFSFNSSRSGGRPRLQSALVIQGVALLGAPHDQQEDRKDQPEPTMRAGVEPGHDARAGARW